MAKDSRRSVVGCAKRRSSGSGISDLLVTVYGSSRTTDAMPGQSETPCDPIWIRVGSIVTDSGGRFRFDYEGTDPERNCRLSHLAIQIATADQDERRELSPGALKTLVRKNAGVTETFLVTIDDDELIKNGWRPATGERSPAEERVGVEARTRAQMESQQTRDEQETALRASSDRALIVALQEARALKRTTAQHMSRFLSSLSTAERSETEGVTNYVRSDADVVAANGHAIRRGVERIAALRRVAALRSTPELQNDLAKHGSRIGAPLTPSAAKMIVPWERAAPGLGVRARIDLKSRACSKPADDDCVRILEGSPTRAGGELRQDANAVDATPSGGPPAQPLSAENLPLFIDRLVRDATSPESAIVFGRLGRATLEDIHQRVDGFSLRSGPADAPAVHDFHHLQIAFEHVWQELFDGVLLDKGKQLYEMLVELGQDPNHYLFDDDESLSLTLPKSKKKSVSEAQPSGAVLKAFQITPEQWTALGKHQQDLEDLATSYTDRLSELYGDKKKEKQNEYFVPGNESWLNWKRDAIRTIRAEAENMLAYADAKLGVPDRFDQFHQLLEDLRADLKRPYRFSVFAANQFGRSVNFGVVSTYEQRWTPQSYQVGRLIKTIPLAPKEVRRFSKKTSVRISRAEKELRNSLVTRKVESEEKTNSVREIVEKASSKTNFQLNARGGLNLGFANIAGSSSFGQNAAEDSAEIKKDFHEAVFKAAEEYRSEINTEVTSSVTEETSGEESGEISNPNDELPVTYMFYELQRRYAVQEKLKRVTPVVLVAQEFPAPGEIDDDWIVRHDWILRRAILDDSFTPALTYLATRVVGDEHLLQEQFKTLQQMRRVHDEIKQTLVEIRERVGSRYAALQSAVTRRASAIQADESESFGEEVFETFAGSADKSPEAMRVLEDSARDAYERESKLEKEVQNRLERETTALSAFTETYTTKLSNHLNRRAQVSRLQVHIKANIMYYMQAIWSHEPHDQRFFRLHEVKVPKLNGKLSYQLDVDADALPMPPEFEKPLKLSVQCELAANIEYRRLSEVADLDTLLGFKGNYMIFPLKEQNALTTYMMAPFLSDELGLRDPDTLGSWALPELVEYVCCLRRSLSEAQFATRLPGLMQIYQRLMASTSDDQTIVVPTDSLFIEALPGAQPILEDFKLIHRAVDVKKVQAEVRAGELENLRAAARLLAGERDDPNIEKKIVVQGQTATLLTPEA